VLLVRRRWQHVFEFGEALALEKLGKIKYGFDYICTGMFSSHCASHWDCQDRSESLCGAICPARTYCCNGAGAVADFLLSTTFAAMTTMPNCFCAGTDASLSSCEPAEAVSWARSSGYVHDADCEHAGGLLVVYAVCGARVGGEGTAAQSAGTAAALWEARGR